MSEMDVKVGSCFQLLVQQAVACKTPTCRMRVSLESLNGTWVTCGRDEQCGEEDSAG